MYDLYFTKDAANDFKKIDRSNLKKQVYKLLDIIKNDPFANPPPYKKLRGIYAKSYSRRINLKHRLFYEVDEVGRRVNHSALQVQSLILRHKCL